MWNEHGLTCIGETRLPHHGLSAHYSRNHERVVRERGALGSTESARRFAERRRLSDVILQVLHHS